MRINKAASIALVAPLAGSLLFAAAPASAAPAVATKAVTAQSDPYSSFDVQVKAPKTAKAGGKVRYSVVATNAGPYEATAGTWFVGGTFPKGLDLKKTSYRASVAGTECSLVDRELFCLFPATVKKGEYVSIVFEGRFKKNAKGTQKAILGVASYNVDTGMENLSKEELDRLGIPGYAFAKLVKTRIVH
ncbi:hypothetical protein ACIBG8_28000 [Nonomuraea sp. NPDC050556]|uniref:hypothetical protein n=1 Tax=Nonomuraea sp. NPDC050556 TaxID=3364369 RepID=UPI0037A376DC